MKKFYSSFKQILKWSIPLIGIALIWFLAGAAQNQHTVKLFETYFNQHPSQIFWSAKNQKFYIPGWEDGLKTSYDAQDRIFIIHIGKVSTALCRQLVSADIPFPHQFWVDGQRIDTQNLSLCHTTRPRYLSFQFSADYKSFAYKLTADTPCKCDKPFISFGLCRSLCLHYDSCFRTPPCKKKQ